MTSKAVATKPQEPTNVFALSGSGNKILVHLNGELVHRAGSMSAAMETVRKRSRGMVNPQVVVDGDLTPEHAVGMPVTVASQQFTLDQKIHFLRTNARLVAQGHSHSFMAIGEGGLGKTWNVMEVLAESGLRDIRKTLVEKEVGHVVNMAKHYRFVKGTGSAKGLYRLLFENNDGLIILDDCDDLLKDKTGQSILKTALDTLDDRWITWQAEEPPGGTDLPREFEYTGRIIFLSNEPVEKINQALKTRCLRTDMTLSRDQIVEYMERYMLESDAFQPKVSKQHKKQALALIKEIKDQIPIKSFSARAFIHACNIRESGEADWKDIATHNLCSK